MFWSFFRKNRGKIEVTPFDFLTIRILADSNIVDPLPTNSLVLEDGVEPLFIDFVMKDFLPGVAVHLALDHQDGLVQWLSAQDVIELGKSTDELFQIAFANLNKEVSKITIWKRISDDGGEVFYVSDADTTTSSLIFAESLWTAYKVDRKDIIAVIPDRDSLFFCIEKSKESLKLLRTMCEDVWNAPDSIKKYRIAEDFLVADPSQPLGWSLFLAHDHIG